MNATRAILARGLVWLCLAGGGLMGCSQPGAEPLPDQFPETTPGPERARALILRVQQATAPPGGTYADWVARQVISQGGQRVFGDWSAAGGTVRFTYALRDGQFRLTHHAYEWPEVDVAADTLPPPRHVDLPGGVAFP